MLSTSYMGDTGNWNNRKSNGLYHLVWDKLLKILSVSLSSWWGIVMPQVLSWQWSHHTQRAATQQSQSSRNSGTKKLQHQPFNSSSYTGWWAVSGDNTFFLHFLVSPVYLDIPVRCGFYYLNWFVQNNGKHPRFFKFLLQLTKQHIFIYVSKH